MGRVFACPGVAVQPFTVAWIAWGVVFVALETWALVSKREGATLSEHLRAWLGIRPVRQWRIVGASLVIGFCLWFAWHITIQD